MVVPDDPHSDLGHPECDRNDDGDNTNAPSRDRGPLGGHKGERVGLGGARAMAKASETTTDDAEGWCNEQRVPRVETSRNEVAAEDEQSQHVQYKRTRNGVPRPTTFRTPHVAYRLRRPTASRWTTRNET